MNPASIWLYLYRCHTDTLCDPDKAVEQTDQAFTAFMARFGKTPDQGKGPGEPTKLKSESDPSPS